MSILPRVSGREVVATLSKLDYEKDRQKGSHIVLRKVAHPHRRRKVRIISARLMTKHERKIYEEG